MTISATDPSAPGSILCDPGTIHLNADRPSLQLTVSNQGDRPIQVGSHYHFFEVNPALNFNREAAYGFRLDIPAGTAVRFEPGDTKSVSDKLSWHQSDTKSITLVALGGDRIVYGLHGLVQGSLDSPGAKEEALKRMINYGFSSTP